MERKIMKRRFEKSYRVFINTGVLPENQEERVKLISKSITPVINQIINDGMSIAIGTWPTPERPITKQ